MESLLLAVIKLSDSLAEVVLLELALVDHLAVDDHAFHFKFGFGDLNGLVVQLV